MIEPVEVALAELHHGVREIGGARNNQRILEYFRATTLEPASGDETPWCAAFVNWCCRIAWVEGTDKANARSFLEWGHNVHLSQARLGDVVVYWRVSRDSWQGHVGFYIDHREDGMIHTLGGNQGNAVSVRSYRTNKLLEVRRVRTA